MNVSLIDSTRFAQEMLIFSKNTRHLDHTANFADVIALSEDDKKEALKYVFGTIGSAFEFVNYTFLFQDVTRAFTHQLVRHRVGTAFAQQSLRVASQDDFRYLIPDNIDADDYLLRIYESTMEEVQMGHKLLLDKGADTQDARGVLPTNICTNILFKANLRTIATMFETRLCVRAQGEFQDVAKIMRNLMLGLHPWAEPVLKGPCCVTKVYCPFKNFDCPIKKANPILTPFDEEVLKIEETWKKLIDKGYSPQPEQSL